MAYIDIRQFEQLQGLASEGLASGLNSLGPKPSFNPLRPLKAQSRVVTIPEGFKGTADTIKEMRRLAREASVDPQFVMFCRSIVAGLPSKAYYGEANRIFEFVRTHVRYVLDPRGMEYVQDPRWVVFVDGQGDCFVRGTQVLRKDDASEYNLVPVESLLVGDEIWGYDRWSKVTKRWDRGIRSTYQILLNNGSAMRLTAEHKVWVVRDDEPVRVPVSELEVNEEVIQPDFVDVCIERKRPSGKKLRVVEVVQDNLELDCFDFETDDHYVWLPEADWTVSQCDDMSTLISAIALSLGHEASFKTIGVDPSRPDDFSHVYPLIGIQKGMSTEWWPADATQKNVRLGWEAPAKAVTRSKVWTV